MFLFLVVLFLFCFTQILSSNSLYHVIQRTGDYIVAMFTS
uniref:Uncharacterized protein n=1 Tax=Setaria viridis TaxID=4556 RepID=A0A4U6TWE4_SETVI|nr:hypothetical protein SEVIR_7G156703v2 [Setaria viridis]